MQALPYVLPFFIAAAVLVACAVTWHRSSAFGTPHPILFLAATAVWALASGAEVASSSYALQLLWAQVQYVGVVAAIPFFVLFTLEYTQNQGWITRQRLVALALVPVLTLILVWTNPYHSLIWSSVSPAQTEVPHTLVFEHGPMFWVWALYAWGCLLACFMVLLREVFASSAYHRAHGWTLIAAMAPPTLVNAFYIVGFNPLPHGDPTPIGFAVSALIVSWGLTRFRLLDLSPVAYEAVFGAIGDGVIVLDHEARVVEMNRAAQRILDCDGRHAVGSWISDIVPGWLEATGSARGADEVRREHTIQVDEQTIELELHVFPLFDLQGRKNGRVVICQDISERIAYQSQIEHMAFHDALTGLPNRRLLNEKTRRQLSLARRHQRRAAMLFLDLDRFKAVNDALGHAAGDHLLQQITSRLQSVMREENTLARLGGDEFAVLLHDGDEQAAKGAALQFLRVFEDPFDVRGSEYFIRATVGIALYPDHGSTEEELLSRADVAMYQAKRAGRRFEIFDSGSDTFTREQLDLETELRRAIAGDELVVQYQPVINLEKRSIHGAEALVRWKHPTRGLIEPDDFLPLVDERGLALDLDRSVLERALSDWHGRDEGLAVNIFPDTLQDERLPGIVDALLTEYEMLPSRLMLEITENALTTPETAKRAIGELKALGVSVAADDFGTGYSSLGYLRHFPLDVLKISPFVVEGIGKRPEDEAIILAVLTVAQSLGMKVVAEGVDSHVQLDWLSQRGCDLVQGFVISRPEATPARAIELALQGLALFQETSA